MSGEISILQFAQKTKVPGLKPLRKQCYSDDKTNLNYHIINLLE